MPTAPTDAPNAPNKPRCPSGRMLHQKHHRTGIFAANRQALHNAQQSKTDRRKLTRRPITGNRPITKVGIAMVGDRKGERRATSDPLREAYETCRCACTTSAWLRASITQRPKVSERAPPRSELSQML